MAESEATGTKRGHGGMRETIKTIVYAVLIALVVRTVALEPFNIPSGSMIPTLLVGDYLFVSKYSYGYSRYSLPFGVPLFSGRILFHEPRRGDVAVFKWPRDNSTDYIKRIIGLPGDRIGMEHGVLTINGEPVQVRDVGRYGGSNNGGPGHAELLQETLPNGVVHPILQETTAGFFNNMDPITVPPGHYFMMGDNRDRSQDSRAWGFVPAVNLVGRAEFLFYSWDGSARWYEFWKWPTAIRFSRIFDPVD